MRYHASRFSSHEILRVELQRTTNTSVAVLCDFVALWLL